MDLAIKEANKGLGIVSPNPLVGALIVYKNNIWSKAYHGEKEKLHAEIIALNKLNQKQQKQIASAILYITLEPCCIYGKTPPCTKAIIKSGIKTVVIAQFDPNPQVYGKSVSILEKAGIKIITKICETVAQHQIRFFSYWIKNQLPYFFGKLAISFDNYYAKVEKQNKPLWISHFKTRQKTRAMRLGFDAILIGKKTLICDNPKLNIEKSNKQLIKIIFCQTADFDISKYQIFQHNNVIIACQQKTNQCQFKEHFIYYKNIKDFQDQVYHLNIQSVLVEGGGETLQLFLKNSLIQELLIVKSKTVKLLNGKKIPTINKEFHLYKKTVTNNDILKFFIK